MEFFLSFLIWILGGGPAHSPYNGSPDDVVYFQDASSIDPNRKSYGGNTIIVVEDTHFKPKR